MDKKLYEKISYIYAGVTGNLPRDDDDDGLFAEQLGDFIHALFNVFANGDKKYLGYFALWNLKEFETPRKATEQVENIIKWNPELKELR
jgi:hypothetical protein